MRHFLCSLLLLLGLRLGGSAAETRTFPLPGGPVELTDVSGTVETYFQSMRPNAAQRQWVFDLVIRNTAVDPLRGPVVVSIEQFDHTSGPLAPEGRDTSGRAWFDLSPRIPAGGLVTGESSADLQSWTEEVVSIESMGNGQFRAVIPGKAVPARFIRVRDRW